MKKRYNLCIVFSCVIILVSLFLTTIVCGAAFIKDESEEKIIACIADDKYKNTASIVLTEGEKALLCRFVSAECQDEPYICRVAAAAVILNRVQREGYPNGVEKVIFSNGGFSSVVNNTIGLNISKEDLDLSQQAVQQAIAGEDPTSGALYFAREGDAAITSISFRAGDMVFGW